MISQCHLKGQADSYLCRPAHLSLCHPLTLPLPTSACNIILPFQHPIPLPNIPRVPGVKQLLGCSHRQLAPINPSEGLTGLIITVEASTFVFSLIAAA